MAYNPPPHYNFGDSSDPQRPQSVPPSYSPQPPPQQPMDAGYGPQQPGMSIYPGQPTQPGIPAQAPGFGTQPVFQPLPPAGRKSPAVPILAVVMAIGLAGAAVSMALWLRSSGDLEDAETRLGDRDSQISQLEEDLEAAETQVTELEGQAAQAEDAESMRECLDDLKWYYSTTAESAEEAEAEAALQVSCQGWIW
ncbi:MAG TPA: hypothetical protein VHG10_02310 [Glycomyces sp.]|nr:hypothetical protein [Glycomyces sp.]